MLVEIVISNDAEGKESADVFQLIDISRISYKELEKDRGAMRVLLMNGQQWSIDIKKPGAQEVISEVFSGIRDQWNNLKASKTVSPLSYNIVIKKERMCFENASEGQEKGVK